MFPHAIKVYLGILLVGITSIGAYLGIPITPLPL